MGATMDAANALSWMSPSLGLALVAALVAALLYALVGARPLRGLPFYWLVALAGFAAGQVIAQHGPRWLRIGDLALGTGAVACIVLFAIVHVITLWYTEGRRARERARNALPRRERLHR